MRGRMHLHDCGIAALSLVVTACAPSTSDAARAPTPLAVPPAAHELPLPVTAPNGGETWPPGAAVRIAWDPRSSRGGTVDLHLLKGDTVVRTISTRAPNDGEHGWLVPRGLEDVAEYRVRMTAFGAADTSDAPFRIGPPAIADYFPLDPANTWTYRTADGSQVVTRVKAAPGEVNGVTARVLVDDTGREDWYTVDAAGLRLHRVVLPDGAQTLTFDPPLQVAPATLELGHTERSAGVVETAAAGEDAIQAPYQCAVHVESFPTIALPGGRSETVKLAGLLLMGGDQRVLFTVWFAPGIGRVQHTGDRDLTLMGRERTADAVQAAPAGAAQRAAG